MIFCENMESKWPLIYTLENQMKVLRVKYKLKSPSSLYVDELKFLMLAKWKNNVYMTTRLQIQFHCVTENWSILLPLLCLLL